MMEGKSTSEQLSSGGGDRAGIAELSERQYACLMHAGEGMSSKEIGRLLGISPSTVDNHIHVAVTKLHARNRWHAAQLLNPVWQQNGPKSEPHDGWIPPLGGVTNISNSRRRLLQILAIAVISIIVLTSLVVSIMGGAAVFGPG